MTASRMLEDLTPEQREKFLQNTDRLEVVGDGLKSPFFEVRPGIIGDGAYDRPLIREKSSVVVAWGVDAQGVTRIGMIRQARPPSDDPERPGNDHPPVVFAQPVMGYFNEGESVKEVALRERLEEAGKGRVLDFKVLRFPQINLEPNTYATWHYVAFVKMDLSTVDPNHAVEDEMIHGVMYLPVRDLLRYIRDGRDEKGAYYRGSGTTLGPLMMFFAAYPEFFPH